MSPKTGFFKGKAHIACPLFIIMRILKFVEYILISSTVTSYRHDKDRRRLLSKDSFDDKMSEFPGEGSQLKGQRSVIRSQSLQVRFCESEVAGQRLRVRSRGSEVAGQRRIRGRRSQRPEAKNISDRRGQKSKADSKKRVFAAEAHVRVSVFRTL